MAILFHLKFHNKMMNSIRLLIIPTLFLLFFNNSYSQEHSIRFKIGYGTYNLEDVKSLHNSIRNEVSSNGVSAKIVKEFPAYLNFQLQFLIQNKLFGYGFFIDKASTGGRITYSDYSGEISVNSIVSRYGLGVTIQKFINHHGIFDLYVTAQLSYLYSTLDIEEYIKIYEEQNETTTTFVSHGIGFEPGAGLEIDFQPFLTRIDLGFQINYSGDFSAEGGGVLNGIPPQWWGFRAGLTLGYNL